MDDNSTFCIKPNKDRRDSENYDTDSTYYEETENDNHNIGHINYCEDLKNSFPTENHRNDVTNKLTVAQSSITLAELKNRSKLINTNIQPQNITKFSDECKTAITEQKRLQFDMEDKLNWLQNIQTIYNKWISGQEPLLERHEAEIVLNNIKGERIKCLNELIKFKNSDDAQVLEPYYKLYRDIKKLEDNFQNEIDLCDKKHSIELEKLTETLDFSGSTIENSSDSEISETTVDNPVKVLKLHTNISTINKATSIDHSASGYKSNPYNGFKLSLSADTANKADFMSRNAVSKVCSDASTNSTLIPSVENCTELSYKHHIMNELQVPVNKINLKDDIACVKFSSNTKLKEYNSTCCPSVKSDKLNNSYANGKSDKSNTDFEIPFNLCDVKSRVMIQSSDISEIEFRSMDISQIFQKMFDMN